MRTMNKAFNYVSNTASEYHKVSKVLRGRKPTDRVPLGDLNTFDVQTQVKIAEVQELLFTACQKLGSGEYNVCQRVLDILTAYLILHYPLMKVIHPEGPAVNRLEQRVVAGKGTVHELYAWSAHLVATQVSCAQEENRSGDQESTGSKDRRVIRHQASVIEHFIAYARRQDERMDALETKLDDSRRPRQDDRLDRLEAKLRGPIRQLERPSDEVDVLYSTKNRKQSSPTHLHAKWYTWYAQEPRLWSVRGDKRKKSDAKILVAIMKLFLSEGLK